MPAAFAESPSRVPVAHASRPDRRRAKRPEVVTPADAADSFGVSSEFGAEADLRASARVPWYGFRSGRHLNATHVYDAARAPTRTPTPTPTHRAYFPAIGVFIWGAAAKVMRSQCCEDFSGCPDAGTAKRPGKLSARPPRRALQCGQADSRFELSAGSAALLRPVFMASPRPLLPGWLKAAEDKQSVRVQAVIVRSAVAPDRIPSCLPRAPAPCSIAGGPAMAWRSGRLAAIRFSARCRSDRCSSIRYEASCRSCCARLALRIVRV